MSHTNRICFLGNNTKTEFYQKVSEYIDRERTRVSWIVVNSVQYDELLQLFDKEDILYLPLSTPELCEPFNIKINDLLFADRRLKQIKPQGLHYLRAIQKPIFDFLNGDLPTLVVGELTYGHEVLTYRLTDQLLANCYWISPFLTRVPTGRFAFFSDEAFSREALPSLSEELSDEEEDEAVDYRQMNRKHIERQSSAYFFAGKIHSFLSKARYDAVDPSWNSNTRAERLRRNVIYMANRISYHFVKKVGIEAISCCKGRSVIFPLHLEPELNIDTCGRYWDNQFETILKIWRQLGPDDQLFVKEHPVAIGNRGARWYQRLTEYPNLKLLDHSVPIEDLLNKIDYIFTISGTMGLEAALKGSRVFCLAPTSYDRLENVVSPTIADFRAARNIDDLYETLRSRKTTAWSVDEYLQHLKRHAFLGDPEGDRIANYDSWRPRNLSRVANAFEFALSHIEQIHVRQTP